MAEQGEQTGQDPRRGGARGEELTHYVAAFALVFVAGFAIVAFVVLSRRRRKS